MSGDGEERDHPHAPDRDALHAHEHPRDASDAHDHAHDAQAYRRDASHAHEQLGDTRVAHERPRETPHSHGAPHAHEHRHETLHLHGAPHAHVHPRETPHLHGAPHAHEHPRETPHSHGAPHAHEHPRETPHSHGPHSDPRELAQAARNGPLERGAGRGKVLYLDAGSGLAGDMIVGALLDLGVPEAMLREALAGLAVGGYSLSTKLVMRSGIAGLAFGVEVGAPQPSRDYASIVQLLDAAQSLAPSARALAHEAFEILARAEAHVHACPIEAVHFHEVGAVDSIVDIVAAAVGFEYLGAEVVCSPLPIGRGSVRSAHGVIPLPAPATLLCLAAAGAPTYDAELPVELVTPTGACLVAAAASRFGGWPSFRPERVGVSAGTRDWPDRPNLLRAVLGVATAREDGAPAPAVGHSRSQGRHVVLEANVDDMSPELSAFALSRALDAGALDAWATPIGMKKGRPAVTLSVLCRREKLDELARVLLSETTSLGLRHYPVDRIERKRRTVCVQTRFGPIDLKVADGDGLDEHAAPEYEHCRRAAETHSVPIRRVYAEALAAFEAQRPKG